MVASLVFYVQNFKESIPTLIVKNSRIIKPNDVEGQKLIQKIDKLTLNGFTMINESNIRILYNRRAEFYIELITEQRDLSDRPATIRIYSRKPTLSWEYSLEDWVSDIINQVKKFSSEVDRSVQEEQLHIICTSLKAISYKNQPRKLLLLYVSKVAIVSIPILISILLTFLHFNKYNINLISFFISLNNIFLIVLTKDKL